jgi:hypothetical protein
MDSSVFMFDDAIKVAIFDYEDYPEENRNRIRQMKEKCMGFWPALDVNHEQELLSDDDDGDGAYLPCEGDQRNCIHSRWRQST